MIEKLLESTEYIKRRLDGFCPDIGIILGSGLGALTEEIKEAAELDYSQIPHFPVSTVPGHAGKMVTGILQGKKVLALKGRIHFYEGYSMQEVVVPVRIMRLLGIRNLLVTNAAGGINPEFEPGDLMLIRDHIKFFTDSPLRGPNLDELGDRFPDMTNAYDKGLREMAGSVAKSAGIKLREGVYLYMAGPGYETPAEIRACRSLGADAVGMSTVPEVIAAVHAGMKVLGISCITNMAAGLLDQPLNHHEVIETAEKVKQHFLSLVMSILKEWKAEG